VNNGGVRGIALSCGSYSGRTQPIAAVPRSSADEHDGNAKARARGTGFGGGKHTVRLTRKSTSWS
jgi:hypothetical protein